MSWLERSGETKRKKEEEKKRLSETKEQQRQLKIKERWGKVVHPAYGAINDWKRLELDKLLADIQKSGLLGQSLEFSDFKCIFLKDESKDNQIVCGFGHHLRMGWRVNASFTFEHSVPEYQSIEVALEAGESHYSYTVTTTPEETSFSHVERSLYYARHEGDGDTWGTITDCKVFTLKIKDGFLVADETNLGPLPNFRYKGDVGIKLDNYISSRIQNQLP